MISCTHKKKQLFDTAWVQIQIKKHFILLKWISITLWVIKMSGFDTITTVCLFVVIISSGVYYYLLWFRDGKEHRNDYAFFEEPISFRPLKKWGQLKVFFPLVNFKLLFRFVNVNCQPIVSRGVHIDMYIQAWFTHLLPFHSQTNILNDNNKVTSWHVTVN